MMLEGERLKQQLSPPDAEDWAKNQYTMRVFTQLVDDTDRNVGNILIDKAWKIYLSTSRGPFAVRTSFARRSSCRDVTRTCSRNYAT